MFHCLGDEKKKHGRIVFLWEIWENGFCFFLFSFLMGDTGLLEGIYKRGNFPNPKDINLGWGGIGLDTH